MRKMNVIRSHKHEVYTETVFKVALSHKDDKRVIREDGIHTYAHGHYKTLHYTYHVMKSNLYITHYLANK